MKFIKGRVLSSFSAIFDWYFEHYTVSFRDSLWTVHTFGVEYDLYPSGEKYLWNLRHFEVLRHFMVSWLSEARTLPLKGKLCKIYVGLILCICSSKINFINSFLNRHVVVIRSRWAKLKKMQIATGSLFPEFLEIWTGCKLNFLGR